MFDHPRKEKTGDKRNKTSDQTLEKIITARGGLLYLEFGEDDQKKGKQLSYTGFMKYLLNEHLSCLYVPNGDILLLEERSSALH